MPDDRHSVSVAGVVVDDQGRALLIQRRDTGHWQAPGGVLEQDEDIVTGLRREVQEETGLEVTPTALTGVYKNMARGIVALVFRCKAEAGTLRESEESSAFCWATADEVAELADEAFAVRVQDALASHSTVPIRQHDGVHILG
ncbi:NUDIX hydrolase [Actinomadura sp. KC216]|uniref:NUDIX hydrolase n=1 Tax=Actinomadura sp. KC216 TaxID=2530370 RepID=UPI00104A4890|nr:NUDIX hydrolase [Actinomadura sp. KC216]TDB83374.1 NUDIX hydrolase [Actinomadura sp. KC216]